MIVKGIAINNWRARGFKKEDAKHGMTMMKEIIEHYNQCQRERHRKTCDENHQGQRSMKLYKEVVRMTNIRNWTVAKQLNVEI